jgi:hypothetical protein
MDVAAERCVTSHKSAHDLLEQASADLAACRLCPTMRTENPA